jgi:DNA-directed RNA polymerase subunit N
MMIPIRCFSCGNPISINYEEYKKRTEKEKPAKILDELGIKKYCCRRMILSCVETSEDLMKYET